MSLSFLTPTRTVALIADDALYIYGTGQKGVRMVETVPWDSANFEKNVATILSKDCGGKPVMILNDMVEQHYRKERVPKVGAMDKNMVLQRKLNVAFPNYPVKAALPLKEKIAKTDKTLAGAVYVFAAVPDSDQFKKTMRAVQESYSPIAGFGLIPIESSDMVKMLADKLHRKSKDKAAWAIFIGQHKNGNLRQIVTKNGELALTRTTPISEMGDDSEQWVQEVHQEFKATMSYLTRFGYAPNEGLDVMVIANAGLGEALGQEIESGGSFHTLTVPEAARHLGLNIGPQEQNFADVLHVAWIGRKPKLLLPMRAKAIESVSKPRQGALAASVLLLAGAAFQGYQSLDSFQIVSEIHSTLDGARQNKAQLDVQYQKEVQRKEDLGFDVKLMQASLIVYDGLDERNLKPLEVFYGIGTALGRDLRIDKITVLRTEGSLANKIVNVATGEGIKPYYEATMQMTFPATSNIDKGNREVRELRERLTKVLPQYQTSVTKFLKDYEYTEQIVVESGDLSKKDVTQDFVAEILMKGPTL